MPIPEAVGKQVLEQLGELAAENVDVVVETLAALVGPKLPPAALPLIKRLIEQVATSPDPLETAKRALISTASGTASDAVIDQLLK